MAARTTSQFMREFNLQLAVNASFFFPFQESSPWDFYPRKGDRTVPLGLSISNGNIYTPPKSGWAALCFAANRTAQISANGVCRAGTQQAVAGNEVILVNGKLHVDDPQNDTNYARTVVALNKAGTKLWLILVDGKQPTYSEGITLEAIAQIALQLGADSAINLDGGGSTTLVAEIDRKPTVLNAPIHTKIPMRERVIANHLGFRAQPITQ
jgi:exopolysaccharide biosynthesis protein